MRKLQVIICGFLVATCLFVYSVRADETGEFTLETVTVTAQKQEEKVQDVPMSIGVLSSENIEDRMIDSVVDIADFVPNLIIFDSGLSGTNSPSTRGIHAWINSLTVSTGLFIDGIPVLTASGFEDSLVDVERVEVLRGPQGTLYGKNTETGAINIITRQPDNTLRGKISGDLGEDDKRELTFNLSGPVMKDKLFFGLAGKYHEKKGFIENTRTDETTNDRKHWYGKGQLRWTPSDRLDISLIFSHLKYDEGGDNMNISESYAAMFGLPAPEDRKVTSDLEAKNETESNMQALKVVYHLSETLRLTSISSSRVYDDVRTSDWDYSSQKIYHNRRDNQYSKLSQELRLDSSTEKLKWLVGVYYDKDDNKINTETDSDIPQMVSTTDRDIEGNASAVFGQAGYSFTEKFRLTAGLRYEKQEMKFKDHVYHTQDEDSWDEVSPKIALDYSFSPDFMTYANVSKGYRSGGFNTFAADSQYVSYDEEIIQSYEVGLKATMLDRRLSINAAFFYMDIKDMQVNVAPDASPMIYLTNATEASAIGVEIDVTARLSEGLSLIASYGYTDIEFDEFEDALGDYQGNRPPYAPEYTYNVGMQYRSAMGFYIRGDLIGFGKVYFDNANEYSQDPYGIVNAKIGYEMEHFDLNLYGKNIFDQEHDSAGAYDGFSTIYSEPREIGVKLAYLF